MSILASFLLVVLTVDVSEGAVPDLTSEVDGAALHLSLDVRSNSAEKLPQSAVLVSSPILGAGDALPAPDSSGVRHSVTLGKDLLLELSPGESRRLQLEGGLWAPPTEVSSSEGVRRLRMVASGAGTITAGLENDTGQPLEDWPKVIEARFQILDGPLKVDPQKTFSTRCPVITAKGSGESEAAFECGLPEGILNLRLSAEGHVPAYHHALTIQVSQRIVLPSFSLQRGASLVGWAIDPQGVPLAEALVILSPAAADGIGESVLRVDAPSRTWETSTDKQGFFQLTGLSTGSFNLQVRAAGVGTQRVSGVVMAEAREHEWPEPIKVPEFPVGTVVVEPARAPHGGPWTVALFGSDVEREAVTGPAGEAHFELLPSGTYRFLLQDPDGRRHRSGEVQFAPDAPRARISLALVPVTGTVQYAGEPLEADLYFGGRRGSESIHVRSGPDGTFSAVLPREGEWVVEIQAAEPAVRVMRRGLMVEGDPDSGVASLALDLPETMIEGTVLGTDGRSFPGAQVIIQAGFQGGGVVALESGPDGRFQAQGLAPGTYHVNALGSGGSSSASVAVDVGNEGPASPLELSLEDPWRVSGTVLDAAGSPVSGAIIWPLWEAADDWPGTTLIRQVRSRADGSFRLEIGASDPRGGIAVWAPGFPLTVAALEAGGEVTLPPVIVDSGRGMGTLSVAPPSGRLATLTLDGQWDLPWALLMQRGPLGGPEGPWRIDALPSGQYRLCQQEGQFQTEKRCAEGYLGAGGQLSLIPREEGR